MPILDAPNASDAVGVAVPLQVTPRAHCTVSQRTWEGVADGWGSSQAEGDNIVAGVAWLRQNAGLLRGKVVEPSFQNMDATEQQELLERIRFSNDEEEKYPLLFTFDFQEDMEVFLNMAAEEDLRVNAMFLGRWVETH
ncbi:unnamed protein product [Arctogadus glacialis]